MNKLFKTAFAIILISFLLSSITSRAAYGVTVGQIFDYEVVAASWDMQVGTNSSSGTGFSFLDTTQAVGTQFEVEVTQVDATEIYWNLTIGTDIETGTNTQFDILSIIFWVVLPALIIDQSPLEWDQTEMDQGVELVELFFLDPTQISDFFNDLIQEDIIDELEENQEWNIDDVGGSFYTLLNVAVFEWCFDGTYTNNTDIFSGDYTFQIAYDVSTGQVKGIYYDIDYSGTLSGEDIIYKMEHKFEEVGYNLPIIPTIPEYKWFISLPIVAILSCIIVLRRRKI